MKVIIQNVVERAAGVKETELPPETVIRFETGQADYSVSFNAAGALYVKKIGGALDKILIAPVAGNVIIVE